MLIAEAQDPHCTPAVQRVCTEGVTQCLLFLTHLGSLTLKTKPTTTILLGLCVFKIHFKKYIETVYFKDTHKGARILSQNSMPTATPSLCPLLLLWLLLLLQNWNCKTEIYLSK